MVVLDDVPRKIPKPKLDFRWDASEPSEFRCHLDGRSYDCGNGTDGSFRTPTLDDGAHELRLEAQDMVGNRAPVQTVQFITGRQVNF